jgi:subtilisin family serine protease
VHSPDRTVSDHCGRSNTFGTDERKDDGSQLRSRGPTRSSYLDSSGVRHYDHLIKPDIVAPGNKIIDAASPNNYLIRHNAWLDAGVSKVDSRRMMYLNGSSVATPVVAGAAALLFQADPTLTPNMVKMLLMYTAQPLAGFNMLGSSGEVNIGRRASGQLMRRT